VAEAAELRGVSVVTIRRMIKRGELEAQKVIRPQGSAYLVTLPEDGTGNGGDAPPTEQPAQNMSRTQGTPADQMMVLIETTITTAVETAITPLVAELAVSRQTIQAQAEAIGRVTAERDAAQTAHESILAAQAEPASSEAPVPWWRARWPWLVLLTAIVVAVGLLALWPR